MSLFDDLPTPKPRPTPRREAPQPAPRTPAPEPARAAAEPARAQPRPEAAVLPVSGLTNLIAGRMKELGRVSVEGEVTALKRAASGHQYFALKDERARLDCKLWQSRVREALDFDLRDGAQVVCHGRIDVYAPRGSYSLIVDRVEQRGLGELLARLERLKSELRERGWFERARPLPPLPRVVGVVTSRDADGWRDFLRTRSMRWPAYPVRLRHTRVQGPGAAAEIAAAIAALDRSGVDVICVIRGGGSLEDLWAFNELPVAEAIWNARAAVVTGVGHESDTTLADHVADHRAHTPTDAAQTVLPDLRQLTDRLERGGSYLIEAMHRHLTARIDRYKRIAQRRTLRDAGWLLERRFERIASLHGRLASAVGRRLERASSRVERFGGSLASQSPASRLARLEARLEALAPRLTAGATAPLERRQQRIDLAARSLQGVSPFAVLERGYSITQTADGRAVRSAADVEPGASLETILADGALRSEVREVRPASEDGAEPA